MKEQILYYAIKYGGEWKLIEKAIKANEEWKIINYDGNYVTIVDDQYPNKLRQLQNPPWIIFYSGDLSLCDKLGAGIVGSRMATAYGIQMCIHVVSILKNNGVIVSGLAKGIDACAHKTALDKETIGVIGCGLDVIYPLCNQALYDEMKRNHLVISEYPNGVKPLAFHFPWRNRIIAALSDALVVIEATRRSGSMLSVNEAIELDIPVYCIPHAFDKEQGTGCNLLISQGANILIDDEDIYNIFHK